MTISFTLQKEDWTRLAYLMGKRTRKTMLAVALCAGLFNGIVTFTHEHSLGTLLFSICFPAIAIPIGSILLMPTAMKVAVRRDPTAFAPRSIEITQDGIRQDTATMDVTIKWSFVTELSMDDSWIYVFGRLYNAAIIIPKRSFNSSDEADAFYGYATKTGNDFQSAPDDQSTIWPPAPDNRSN